MPIYAYRCERCGHAKDVIQKFSDAPLSLCPECGADAFRKQLTAPAFQLKGSGWYVTDFRDNGRKAAKPDGATADAKPEAKPDAGSGTGSDTGAGTGAAAQPAPAKAPESAPAAKAAKPQPEA